MKTFNLHKKPHIYIILILILIGAPFLIREFYPADEKTEIISTERPVRIGYFHGGRVNMMYRTLIYDYFDEEGVSVELYTRFLKKDELFKVPETDRETTAMWIGKTEFGNPFGKMRGTEIVDEIMAGELDGGTIGESSFIDSIVQKSIQQQQQMHQRLNCQ